MSASPSPTPAVSQQGSGVASPHSRTPALPDPLLSSFDIKGLASFIEERKPTKVLVMMGAGASVAAGIPDFRTPGVGLYSKLAAAYPELAARPEQLFDLASFRSNPLLFYTVMNEMKLWPDQYRATDAHMFVKLLQDKGILLRCYTQNIDTLERTAGIRDDLLVEAHGAFASAHCIDCKAAVSIEYVEECAKAGSVPRCKGPAVRGDADDEVGADGVCDGLVKPDVVFFGESLPPRFFELIHSDSEDCDLLIIIGTSLKVFPFAMVPNFINRNVPRVLINMMRAGDRTFVFQTDVDGSNVPVDLPSSSSSDDDDDDDDGTGSSSSSEGPNATPLPTNELLHCYRDLLLVGDCQSTIRSLVETLGWTLPPQPSPSA